MSRGGLTHLFAKDPKVNKVYRRGYAEARKKLMKKGFEKAMGGDTALIIFMMKCLCGMREDGRGREEDRDPAELARIAMEELKQLSVKEK